MFNIFEKGRGQRQRERGREERKGEKTGCGKGGEGGGEEKLRTPDTSPNVPGGGDQSLQSNPVSPVGIRDPRMNISRSETGT